MSMAQVLKLKPAFNDQQAEALARLCDEELATRRDLEVIRINLDATKAELKSDIERLRLEVQRHLKGTEARLVTWVVGQGAATIGILFALLHFFGK